MEYIGAKSRLHYTVIEQLSHIGMSTVFLVKDQHDPNGGTFVLKLAKDTHPETLHLFEREIQNHIRLNNFHMQEDGLITLKEEIQPLEDGTCGFIMEYIQHGKNIQTWLREQQYQMHEFKFNLLALKVLWRLVRLTSGLHKAGFLHNDIKPGNVFICGRPENFQMYLLDLGIAKHKSEKEPMNGAMGTPGFSAPECCDPEGKPNPACNLDFGDDSSDIYALIQTWIRSVDHTVTYTVLPENITRCNSSTIPPVLQDLLRSAIQPQAKRTYRDSHAFFSALTHCILFQLPYSNFVERVCDERGIEFMEWYHCPLSDLQLPQQVTSQVTGPTLTATKQGIFYNYMRDSDSLIQWGTPEHHPASPVERVRLKSNCLIHWKYPQKGAFVDIYFADSNLPSQRLEFPHYEESTTVHLEIERIDNHFYITHIQSSRPENINSVAVFAFSQFQSLYQLHHRNGEILNYFPVERSDVLYFVWDTTTLRIVDVIGYNDASYTMQSCLHDDLVVQDLSFYTNMLKKQALQFPKIEQPLLTEKSIHHLFKMAERWTNRLSSNPSETVSDILSGFHTHFTTSMKEAIGIAIKLTYTPQFNQLPKEDWIRVFLYCQAYNIRTHNFWVLYFFLGTTQFWPLYSGRAKRLSSPFTSSDTIVYLNTNADPTVIEHMMSQGCRQPLYRIRLQMNNGLEQSIALFVGESLNVGRWSVDDSPEIAVLLTPYMSTHVLSIDTKGNIRPSAHQFISSRATNSHVIKDGGLFKECINPSCGHIYDHDTTRCSQQACINSTGGQLKVRQTQEHTITVNRIEGFEGIECHVTTRNIKTRSALNAVQIDRQTVLYIQGGLPMITSRRTLRLHREHGTDFLAADTAHRIPPDTTSIQFGNGIFMIES